MPTVSPSQYGFMALIRSGKKKVKGLTPAKAKEFMDATPPDKRSEYAKVLAGRRSK